MAQGAQQQQMINQMVSGAVEAMEASVDAVSYYLRHCTSVLFLYLLE